MKGVDSLALTEEGEVFEKYGDSPMYTALNKYIDNELIKITRHFKQLRKGERQHGNH